MGWRKHPPASRCQAYFWVCPRILYHLPLLMVFKNGSTQTILQQSRWVVIKSELLFPSLILSHVNSYTWQEKKQKAELLARLQEELGCIKAQQEALQKTHVEKLKELCQKHQEQVGEMVRGGAFGGQDLMEPSCPWKRDRPWQCFFKSLRVPLWL